MKLFKNLKGHQKLGAFALAGSIAILAVGCGKQRAGQYQGLETVQTSGTYNLSGGTSGAIRTSAVITIQESSSEMISGDWTTRNASGRFTGILRADQIQILSLTRGSTSTQNNLTTAGMPLNMGVSAIAPDPMTGSVVAVCPGEYMGTLKLEGDRIVGSIQPSNAGMNPCTQIDVDVTKVN